MEKVLLNRQSIAARQRRTVLIYIGIPESLLGDTVLIRSVNTVLVGIGKRLHNNYSVAHINGSVTVCIAPHGNTLSCRSSKGHCRKRRGHHSAGCKYGSPASECVLFHNLPSHSVTIVTLIYLFLKQNILQRKVLPGMSCHILCLFAEFRRCKACLLLELPCKMNIAVISAAR